MQYPRILIFGQPFNDFSGGGITLTNLFKGWPKSEIAVTFIGHGLFNVTTDVFDTYYQLGKDEHKWIFPFNLIQRKFESGLRVYCQSEPKVPINFFQAGIRYKIVNNFFYPFLKWIGLFHAISKISLSESFKQWLSEFKPDILYIQASTRETILFASDLCDYLNKPSIIHVMDDWPSTISNSGILRNYWKRKIDKEFRKLLDKVSLHLSISEAMSEEYLTRYKKTFVPFHNPIETSRWMPYSKKEFAIDPGKVKMLYSGRLGDNGIANSLLEIAFVLDRINNKNLSIELHIQTPTKSKQILDMLNRFKCVVLDPFVDYEQVPQVFSKADILVMANDFDEKAIKYLKLSMPTKASEYMISGTPIFVYASDKTALVKFFQNHKCGHCVTVRDAGKIEESIRKLITDIDYRKALSETAVNLALMRFDASKVRSEFQVLISKTA